MSVAIVTGSSGLIGSEAARFLDERGLTVVGIDNNLREYFFGEEGSTAWNTEHLKRTLKHFSHASIDVRDAPAISEIFARHARDIVLVVHAAAQPSHDWARREPMTDFSVNAVGALTMLEATRRWSPDATFVLLSTNKVYGDAPNRLPMVELATRWEVEVSHPFAAQGIDETLSIDQSLHSLFGASKVAADVMTQEYGRYFGLKTGIFRCGCLTGPAHSGTELHGFLAYLVKCIVTGKPYTIYGYKGKQVRDNLHSYDLVQAIWHFFQAPRAGEVYNIGGSRHSNCSMLEAISYIENACSRQLNYSISDTPRIGDHQWWITDVSRFSRHFGEWRYRYDQKTMVDEIVEATLERERTAR
jgi:CDP-paratose 2-epimerase